MKKIIISILILSIFSCQESIKQKSTNKITSNTLHSIATIKEETITTTKKSLQNDIFFPNNFRTWKRIKSMVLQKGHPLFENFGGMHHIYANEKALEGYNTGRFPNGSMIVFDLWEAIEKNNTITEGTRKVIGVMYKNSNMFTETGGWIFGTYKNIQGKKVEMDWKTQCFSCHASQKNNDYVFSSYNE